MTTDEFRAEAYAEQSGEAYLTLLTVKERDGTPLFRFTSDMVPTFSNGDLYTPLAFKAVTPDRVEGRQPQGRIQLDNVNQATIAAIRSLQEFPLVDMALVRASDPDTKEAEFANLEMGDLSADTASLLFTVQQHDLDREPFPPRVFDISWRGVWDT